MHAWIHKHIKMCHFVEALKVFLFFMVCEIRVRLLSKKKKKKPNDIYNILISYFIYIEREDSI